MAAKDIERRLMAMERRLLVKPAIIASESHADLGRELVLSRMILGAEIEAINRLEELKGKGVISYQQPALEIQAKRDARIAACRLKVAEIERRCADAGMAEEDIRTLGK